MGGADLSQLHAWLLIHTLTLTRQRGDTSCCCRDTRSCTHTQTCALTLTCARTLNLYKYISGTSMNPSVDSGVNVPVAHVCFCTFHVFRLIFLFFEKVSPVVVILSDPEENKL